MKNEDGSKDHGVATFTIEGTNDAAVVSADVRNLTETNAAADISTSGTLTISDVDSAATFQAQTDTVGSFGTFSIVASGAWTYTADQRTQRVRRRRHLYRHLRRAQQRRHRHLGHHPYSRHQRCRGGVVADTRT